jgi:hypothetical protein
MRHCKRNSRVREIRTGLRLLAFKRDATSGSDRIFPVNLVDETCCESWNIGSQCELLRPECIIEIAWTIEVQYCCWWVEMIKSLGVS